MNRAEYLIKKHDGDVMAAVLSTSCNPHDFACGKLEGCLDCGQEVDPETGEFLETKEAK